MTEPKTVLEVIAGSFQHYLPFELGRYFITATVFVVLVWVLERTAFRSRRLQSRLATLKDIRREVSASVLTIFVYLFISVPVEWAAHNGLLAHDHGGHTFGYNALMLAAMIVVHDAYFYWTHRAMHARRLFKTFHRHHHLSITPTPWTAYSFAVPEAVVNGLFVSIWLLFVPTPWIVTLAFLTAQIIRNVTAHAGLELHPRWWLDSPLSRWISTTTHHDLHHSGGFNYNYGFWFTYWDRLMGTEHPRYHEAFARVTAPVAARPEPITESRGVATTPTSA